MDHFEDTKIMDFRASDFFERVSSLPEMNNIHFPEETIKDDFVKCIIKREGDVFYFTFAYFEGGFFDGKSQEQLIYDLWRTSTVNVFYEYIHEIFSSLAKGENKVLSPLYGPGYYNMPLTETENILKKAGGEKIGVSVNECYIMTPPFSRCGIFVLEDELAKSDVNQCEFCKGNKGSCSLCNLFTGARKGD